MDATSASELTLHQDKFIPANPVCIAVLIVRACYPQELRKCQNDRHQVTRLQYSAIKSVTSFLVLAGPGCENSLPAGQACRLGGLFDILPASSSHCACRVQQLYTAHRGASSLQGG